MNRNHGYTTSNVASEPSEARAPSHAERCRTLAAQARAATLCTLAREPAGYPYGSLVAIAFDQAGRPLLLLSELAEHTSNLVEHAQASVLVSEPIEEAREPLAVGRMTLLGQCQRVAEDESASVRAAFLAKNPGAAYYVDFSDFGFYRLEPASIRYVGGFGRMSWVSAEDYRVAEADPLAAIARGVLDHMNDDHRAALLAYARTLLSITDASDCTMSAVDRYGFDMSVTTPTGKRAARLAFTQPVSTSDEVRNAMIGLVQAARAKGAEPR
jgi:heme iron utilization protein